jgi:hypothetical protein
MMLSDLNLLLITVFCSANDLCPALRRKSGGALALGRAGLVGADRIDLLLCGRARCLSLATILRLEPRFRGSRLDWGTHGE